MKYIDEYRDKKKADRLIKAIGRITRHPWQIMEICGGQTHTILKYGINQLLPDLIQLIHGPGCPVCVTDTVYIDQALEIAAQKNVIFTSFGDMLRVPGSTQDLLGLKARGADIRVVFSPLDALSIARQHPQKEVVFFGVGFETTAPVTALALYQAKKNRINNFSIICAHVLVPPAITALLNSPDCKISGFIAPGHVITVTGYQSYEKIARQFKIPFVVAGFEPLDILAAVYLLLENLEQQKFDVINEYSRAAPRNGNPEAMQLIDQIFENCDQNWRGIGPIAASGYQIKKDYQAYDSLVKFNLPITRPQTETECIAGQIMQGIKHPPDCPHFNQRCTPKHPLGPAMVSQEGACAAYYQYQGPI